MKYTLYHTTQYKKSLKQMIKRGADIEKLNHVVNILVMGEKLPPHYLDHKLKGDKNGLRDCHIEPDWILIYQINKNRLILTLTHTGSHSDLLF